MLDQLSDLQNKEQMLIETNRALQMKFSYATILKFPLCSSFKLEEISSRNNIRHPWDGGDQSMSYGTQNAQTQGFFQPLDCNPTLQIGYTSAVSDQITSTTTPTHAQQVNGFLPGWML
ncbi:developmental protein SEPALLATA 1 [Cucumis melo var. makuwa]|uniref:Developmental protein SEPALLATA 1 n=1 Tax=Cucumis melo var. makuwa TaxID=1194695 RepID=A0A5D3CTS6_CUCMM|nr:developmental protein SEPALLATA 1 [Cucumis melo var. makuwa]